MKTMITTLIVIGAFSLHAGRQLPVKKLRIIKREFNEVASKASRLLKRYKAKETIELSNATISINIVLGDKTSKGKHTSAYIEAIRTVIQEQFPNNASFRSVHSRNITSVTGKLLDNLLDIYVNELTKAVKKSGNKELKKKVIILFKRGIKRMTLQKDSGMQESLLANNRVNIIQEAFEKISTGL